MDFLKKLSIPLTVLLTSLFYFPFNPTFLSPGSNTKLVMAVIGLPMLFFNLTRKRNPEEARSYMILSALALVVSFAAFFSITINNTPDATYVSYIGSMWVWLSAAYVVIQTIRWVHGEASLALLCNYIIAVCVAQCVIAIAIDQYPAVRTVFDSIQGRQVWLQSVDRLYGLGATLDTAGIRFSVAEVMIAYMLTTIDRTKQRGYMFLYIISFIVLVVIGNMMARTTSVGTVLAILYLVMRFGSDASLSAARGKVIKWFVVTIVITIPVVTFFYNTNEAIHDSLRFGFEGFFNLFENGEWKIGSNDTLKGMVVFPDNMHTWIVGDGYFLNPKDTDPYYTGEITIGYYKNTDIGYLRFIFYFGIIGLLAFSAFILRAGWFALEKFPQHKLMIFFLLAVNFICWTKVATDIFLVFALLYMITKEENDAYDQRMALPEETE